MLWIKALHIIFITSWFAGLFYLPRLFVNHAMVLDSATPDQNTSERLKLMEKKTLPFYAATRFIGTWVWALAMVRLWYFWCVDARQANTGYHTDWLPCLLRQTGE